MLSFKYIAKFATQFAVSLYVSKVTNRLVGQAFDRVFGTTKPA
jgi:hypothetical protein